MRRFRRPENRSQLWPEQIQILKADADAAKSKYRVDPVRNDFREITGHLVRPKIQGANRDRMITR